MCHRRKDRRNTIRVVRTRVPVVAPDRRRETFVARHTKEVEMTEIRSIVTAATSRSLVLVDEICRGTETAKGTCIAGSIIETLDRIGCLGIISTHLHGIFSLPLNTKKTVHKAMGTTFVDGQPQPTWKLIDGICRESLAFETAKKEGVPEAIIERAEELYLQSRIQVFSGLEILNGINCKEVAGPDEGHTQLSRIGADTLHHEMESKKAMRTTRTSIERDIMLICRKKFMELHKLTDPSESSEVQLHSVAAREQPPPSTIGASVVYVMLRPDKKIYVGQTDDLEGRIRAHRSKEGMQKASFLYFSVSGKSIACQLETLLINQLSDRGFQLTNIADGKHRNFGSSGDSLGSMAVL